LRPYLLKLEPDRNDGLLCKRAGLTRRRKATGLGWGWEDLTGPIAGISVGCQFDVCGDRADKRFKGGPTNIVQEMKEVKRSTGNGYLGALEHGEERLRK